MPGMPEQRREGPTGRPPVKSLLPIQQALLRWWKQIAILVAVLLYLALTDKLTIWHVLVFSVLAGVWLARLDRRR